MRLGYPLRDVCWHFTIADLAMAGASAALLAVEPGPWSASAPCKRALRGASCGAMKEMFGKDQLSAMADLVQGSLMLRYNKRCVG